MNNSTQKTKKKSPKKVVNPKKKSPKKVVNPEIEKLKSKIKFYSNVGKAAIAAGVGMAAYNAYKAYKDKDNYDFDEYYRYYIPKYPKESDIPKLPDEVQSDINEILNSKTKQELKQICRKKYLKYHPDKQPNKEISAFFTNIRDACETIL